MDELLEDLDNLLSNADETFIETHAESIAKLRGDITEHSTTLVTLQSSTETLMEQNISLTEQIKDSKKKYYEKFMNTNTNTSPNNDDENKPDDIKPLSDLLKQI